MAFSTASAPEFCKTDFFLNFPGVNSLSASHTSIYPRYGAVVKFVCVNAATASCTRETTRGLALPTVTTPIPEPRSMMRLPSRSSIIAPSARVIIAGKAIPTPPETASLRRAITSADLGPGIAVAMWRDCGRKSCPRRLIVME